jgi:membrane protein DedA with SNARE-associated domain
LRWGSIDAYAREIVEFIKAHQDWAAPIVFVLAFGESLAFISLLLPAAIGAALGDWLSYWIGVRLGPSVQNIWPLSRHPDLIPKGETFVKKWGAAGIFIGRFFGPLRASVPLVAGIFKMPFWHFQTANFTSAFVWAAVLLTIGDVVTHIYRWIVGS